LLSPPSTNFNDSGRTADLVSEGEVLMRRLSLFSALLLALNLSANLAPAQNGATTTVTANPATITVGSSVALTATVQPNNVSLSPGHAFTKPGGTITFLDGSTPLDNTPLPLAPNTFASATFQQAFGTPDSTFNRTTIPGELTGDLNGDGVSDLLIYGVVTQNPPLFAVQTFISSGKGGYTPSAVQTFPFLAYADGYMRVANIPFLTDLNGDGKLDLVCGVQVAYGNGDGTFATAVTVPFLSSSFVSTYAADLNGDGKTDILAVNASPDFPKLEYSVTPFLNQGAGSFTPTAIVPIGQGGMPLYGYQPAFVDLNGDGNLDIILQWSIVAMGAPNVSVLLSNGDGTFASPTGLNVSFPPNITDVQCSSYEIGSGDLNADGNQDLILATCDDNGNSDAIIFLGNGDGTFESPTFFALPTPPNVVINILPNFIVQDVNLDGKLDLVFGSGRLALGNGDGTFTLGTPLFPLPANYPLAYPLVQMDLPGNSVPSLVFLPLSVTPPPAAVFTPQTSSSVSLSLTTLSVGAHTISGRYSGDANYAADTSPGVVVTVNQAASATAVTSSVNPSFAGQSVTLTANVTSSGPTPTGNVVFTSGSTTLGTVALTGGTAAYTTSSFDTAGTQMITAAYSGDANTQASSASLSQVVNAAFTLAPGAGGSTTLTVNAGQIVTAPINVTGDAGFSGQVTFACSGLPANASCSFSPATINVSGTPAVPTLLSLNTAAATTTSQLRLGLGAYGLAFAGLVLFWPARHRGTRIWVMLFCAIGFATLGLSGCSGGSGSAPPAQTAAGTYSFTVVASSGSVKTQSAYTLVVQ
jgi:Bacterial Ig-like domain (group 3)/FG-GAP-like repeat